jgi:type VII secretion protein EccB
MQSRKDQLQAHYFVVGRLASAMMRADPDAPQTPLRRFSMGTFTGVMLAVLGIVGFAVYGFFVPGGQRAWQEQGALILEKETGARYVYVDGELRPLLNYTSGRLILGNEMHLASVSRNSLKGVPHGLPVGIPAAPDFLPEAGRLRGRNWQVCTGSRRDDANVDRPFVTLRLSSAARPSLPLDRGLIVATPDKETYLAWNDRRLRIADPSALAALGFGNVQQLPVGPAWINALPAGPDLRAREVPGLGTPGPAVSGRATRIGQVFVIESAGVKQHFVVLADGLAPTTWTDAVLILGHPGTASAYPGEKPHPIELSPGDFATAPRSQRSMVTPAYPASKVLPQTPTGEQVPCVQATAVGADGKTGAHLALDTPPSLKDPAAPGAAAAAGGGPSRDGALADRVEVEPGGGLLARAQPAPGVTDGTLYLIVDVGVKYPLPSADVAGALDYGGVDPVAIPTNLLALIPTGPALDPADARVSAPAAPQGTGVTNDGSEGGRASAPGGQPTSP